MIHTTLPDYFNPLIIPTPWLFELPSLFYPLPYYSNPQFIWDLRVHCISNDHRVTTVLVVSCPFVWWVCVALCQQIVWSSFTLTGHQTWLSHLLFWASSLRTWKHMPRWASVLCSSLWLFLIELELFLQKSVLLLLNYLFFLCRLLVCFS